MSFDFRDSLSYFEPIEVLKAKLSEVELEISKERDEISHLEARLQRMHRYVADMIERKVKIQKAIETLEASK